MGVADDVREALTWLEKASTRRDLANLERFGIAATRPFGVSMANLQILAKRLGRNHDLAAALWKTGRYEARMLAALVEEPSRVTPAQMDRWCRDFDNWGICDTVCICLFDRTPHGFGRVKVWAPRRDEFVKRAAFALLAGLALHDKAAGDEAFLRCLPLIEAASSDERNFVKKAVNWALRAIGRRNVNLHAEALVVARRLSDGAEAAPRWIGKGAIRELTSPVVMRKLAGHPRLAR
jgi:3-methyladenine DNA glycosylase AlkD